MAVATSSKAAQPAPSQRQHDGVGTRPHGGQGPRGGEPQGVAALDRDAELFLRGGLDPGGLDGRDDRRNRFRERRTGPVFKKDDGGVRPDGGFDAGEEFLDVGSIPPVTPEGVPEDDAHGVGAGLGEADGVPHEGGVRLRAHRHHQDVVGDAGRGHGVRGQLHAGRQIVRGRHGHDGAGVLQRPGAFSDRLTLREGRGGAQVDGVDLQFIQNLRDQDAVRAREVAPALAQGGVDDMGPHGHGYSG